MIFQLLIVDDESTMRKGISNFMNWESIGCEVAGTASDGIEAIDFIKKNHVDIVITDIRMPVSDGLEVAKYVYENMPDVQVILLTGFADFEYAQRAIHYNVSAFILKPTNKKDLFEAVQSAQKKMLTSKKNNSAAEEDLTFLKEQLLQELTGSLLTPSLEQRIDQYGICLVQYYIAAFQITPPNPDISSFKKLILSERAYCFRYNHLVIVVYYQAKSGNQVPGWILDNCSEIAAITHTLDSSQAAIGISRSHDTAAEFSTAVSEAIYALSLAFYTENNIARFTQTASPDDYDINAENSMDLLQLENTLNQFSFDESRNIIHNLFTKFKRNLVKSRDAKNICSQIYYICSRVSLKRGITPCGAEYLTGIYNSNDIFTLETSMLEMLDTTISHLTGSGTSQNKIVEDTIKYIHSHLSESLSLETIAENLHISPSHLSRTFRKSYSEPLTEYINKTRIEKAKEYLINPGTLSYEVAGLVGYNDPTYFSSIFKKYTGTSPTEFKHQYRYKRN